jgi:hypothetical protein
MERSVLNTVPIDFTNIKIFSDFCHTRPGYL